ncbi:hypothetical protein HGRIS_003029 [Hohenbuehelia grisea]|uniref:DUF2421 domain-containing protein n=1 Tax=Hohenbuehelia grisea TaxID=104357 RepID=A0ABR3JN85_9AGAR
MSAPSDTGTEPPPDRPSAENTRTSPINVPGQSTRVQEFRGSEYLSPVMFVGSPEQINSSSSTPLRRDASPGASNRTPVRPTIGHRSISSPFTSFSGRLASSSSPRVNTTVQPSSSLSEAADRQWSLFGQLMENEGLSPVATHHPTFRRARQLNPSSLENSTSWSSSVGHLADAYSSVAEAHPDNQQPEDPFRANDSEATLDDGDDYDSDSSSSTAPFFPPTSSEKKSSWWRPWSRIPAVPLLYRNIFKCALAYFIASLFTYSPHLSGLISDITSYRSGSRGPVPSGHMVATIAVYFHPAKTMGAMYEADIFCLGGILYSAVVSLTAMTIFWWLELQPGWEWLGDVVAVVWICLSMSFVAWMKVYMANPQFNTACSMIAIILFSVLVKEGGFHTLVQVAFIALCGSLTSNLVCYLVWPQTATKNLQTDMTKTLGSFSTILKMLTRAFLLEEDLHPLSQERISKAVQNHQNSFTSLKKNLNEAKNEWLYGGPGSRARDEPNPNGRQDESVLTFREDGKGAGASMRAYEDAVDSMTRLAQHLNGLRSGTRLQYELAKAGGIRSKKRARDGAPEPTMDVIDEDTLLKASAEMFGDLVDDLGPPMKALSTTCTHSLKVLGESFEQSRIHRSSKRARTVQPQDFIELVESIERALVRFESTSNHAVLRLYRKSDMISASHQESLANSIYSNVESAQGENAILFGTGDNEHVFLVYFFIFTLQEFSRELVSLVDAMERIYSLEQERVNRGPWWQRWFTSFVSLLKKPFSSSRPQPARQKTGLGLRRSLAHMIPQIRRVTHPAFPKIKPHAPNTMQTPPRLQLTIIGRIKQTLWAIGNRLGERDAKYAIKAGAATAILAAPAFVDETRQVFLDWSGDWALISFFVVLSPTIGATNFLSLHRVLGTLFGATVAAGIYTLFPDNAVVLPIFGFFFSLPCFYYTVATPQYASSSRFVLLTYNLTCLYCYNLRSVDISPVEIAFHRVIAVTVGVLYAALVARIWWPAEARRELGKALGEFCLNIGWLYTRLVASNSYAPDTQDDPSSAVAETQGSTLRHSPAKLSNSIQEFMAMELHLQIKLIELQGLLSQTQHEPRLKGPFPVQLYRGVLTSLQTILDRLHSMRCVTTREEWYTHVRQDFIVPVNRERHEMVGNIILSFSTLASAFRLKAPLPPYLPPAEKSRQRLVEAIRRLEIVRNREVKGSRHLLFFAYVVNLKGVTEELESLGRTLQNAFGVIGQTSEEFEALFNPA